MKNFAPLIAAALILTSIPAHAVRVAAPVLKTAPAAVGNIGAAAGAMGVPRSAVSTQVLSSLSPQLTLPASLPSAAAPSVAAPLQARLEVQAAAPRAAQAASAAPPRRIAAAQARARQNAKPAARKELKALAAAFTPREGKRLGKSSLDKAWDRFNAHDDAGETPTPVDGAFDGVKNKADQLKRRKDAVGTVLRAAAAAAPIAAAPVAAKWAYQLPWVNEAWGKAVEFFLALPDWGQTGLMVAGGGAAAYVIPKVVRAGAKWVFKWVDWDPLRESFLVNVVTAAAWIGAAGFAMLQLGGVEVLALNGTVFGITTTLATQDLMKNVTSGFSLYRNRPFELGQRVEVEDMKARGQVIAFNPRFVTLDTRYEEGEDYERILLPNDKLLGKAVTNLGFPAAMLGLGLLAFVDPTLVGPLTWGLKIFATITASLAIGSLFQLRARAWEVKAQSALPNLEEYKRYSLRSKIHGWLGNGAYLAGLYVILNMFGVPLSGIVGSLSLVSAAMGFWTKDVATNLVAGLMVAVWRPFSAGDDILIGKHAGKVEDITQRYILLRQEGGGAKYVPLSDLMHEVIRVGKKPD